MGKKVKPLKIKQYKVPRERFLVVINPWGVEEIFDDAAFNQINAWFEIMLRDENPEAQIRLKAIYYQRVHPTRIIVELPKETKGIEQILGTHNYTQFLRNFKEDTKAYIYEYKYASFGDPTNNLNFGVEHAKYNKIPDNFPIAYPYPLPSPAPPPPIGVHFAQAIPPEVNERIANRLRDPRVHTTPDNDPDSYKPSAELLDVLASLLTDPTEPIKEEPREEAGFFKFIKQEEA